MTAFVENLLYKAGDKLLSYWGKVAGQAKGAFDIVTEADQAIEQFIIQKLQAETTYQIIAEESANQIATLDEWCWILDPLDGTVNFALQIPFYAISLALFHNGSPHMGWIYDPVRRELYFAEHGKGSFLNGEKLNAVAQIPKATPIGGSSSGIKHMSAQSLQNFMREYGKLRILGAQALHLCYVATGQMQAAISHEAKLWDNAAGALIVTEAGGKFTDWAGQPLFPMTTVQYDVPTIAAHTDIHQAMVDILKPTP